MPTTTYQVTLGQRVVLVRVRLEGDRALVTLGDGPEQPARLRTVHGALRSLQLGDRRTELLAVADQAGVTLSIGGLELRADVLDEAHARLTAVAGGHSAGHARRELKAPMPGLVVSVLCEPGDSVEAGQPLIVLQAMKMENELSLPRGGSVTTITAAPGQTVEQGQVLVVVE